MTLCLVAAAAGCESDDDSGGGDPRAVTFHFKMVGDAQGLEDFRAVTSDASVIAIAREQLSKPAHERNQHIAGAIDHGNGGFNLAWNWHFVPDSWSLAEISIELCDTSPTLISQCVECWVEAPSGACPWSSYVDSEVTQ
jgi:hypothetical protein